MITQYLLKVIQKDNRNFGEIILCGILYLFSILYQAIVRIRIKLYELGIFHQEQLSIPVISIGNITTGGTGKTPMVRFLATYFQQQEKKVAILSRGYRKKNPELIQLVSDYEKVKSGSEETGDEPLMLAQLLPGVPVLVGNDRRITGKYAMYHLNPDLIILDDGFSHQRVNRTLDLVLLDASNPFSNGYCLPRGLLREPASSLTRADAIVVTKMKPNIDYSQLSERIRKIAPTIPIFYSNVIADKIIEIQSQTSYPLSMLNQKPVFAFAGIANPESFHDFIIEQGAQIKRFIPFPDHYTYSQEDIQSLIEQAEQQQCQSLITTAKDAVKIKPLIENRNEQNIQFYWVDIRIVIQNEQEFFHFIQNRLKS